MKVEKFKQAGDAFEVATQRCRANWRDGESFGEIATNDLEKHFVIAAIAVTRLNLYSDGELKEFEKQHIVSGSTITGASLLTARLCIERYFLGDERRFTRDEYEQLMRTCYSALSLERKGIRIGAMRR